MRNARGIFQHVFGNDRSVCLAPSYLPAYLLTFVLLLVPHAALAQSNAEWTQYKIKCGIPASTAYNDWVAQGSPCPKTAEGSSSTTPAVPALNPQQQLAMQGAALGGYMIGQGLHQLLFGPPPSKPGLAPPDPAQQQRDLAAQQLNNSGLYLLRQKNYAGAINEFQQALANTPNDANIQRNLALAKQKLKDSAVASQTSGALGQFLGNPPTSNGNSNFDQLAHSFVANPNASALSLINLDSDARVVDLRDSTKTSIDPQVLKGQLDAVFTNNGPVSAPPDSLVVLPQAQDIELLFPGSPSTPFQSPVVLPQAEDIELLFPGSPSGSVVLPQVQDLELLFQPPQSKPSPKKNPVLPHN